MISGRHTARATNGGADMTLTYDKAASDLFATGSIPNGYFGARTNVGWHFDKASGKTMAVDASGFHTECIPPAVDFIEAVWLLKNHPSAKGRVIVRAHRITGSDMLDSDAGCFEHEVAVRAGRMVRKAHLQAAKILSAFGKAKGA